MTGFYHLCFVVPDLAEAMDELERGLGAQWNEIRSGESSNPGSTRSSSPAKDRRSSS